MADLPVDLPEVELVQQLARALDVEGKIPRALEALGPVSGRDVVLVDGAAGIRARQLVALGARLVALERAEVLPALEDALADLVRSKSVRVATGSSNALGLPDSSADVVVACWSSFRGPIADELAEADRVLRPGGRLLVVHDYGRDDASRLADPARPEYTTWSHRDSTYLRSGFKIRVIHCFWTFDAVDRARDFLDRAFGERGRVVAGSLQRPRLSYNVAVYHRTKGVTASAASTG